MHKIAPAERSESDPDETESTSHSERARTVRVQALALLEQMHALAAYETEERLPTLQEYIDLLQDFAGFADSSSSTKGLGRHLTTKQLRDFGNLLRDKRNAAGFSRVQLARKAKISDATIKFLETARHPPSRATLIRLINVEELNLSWAEVPGHHAPPSAKCTLAKEVPSNNPTAKLLCVPKLRTGA